MSLKEVIPLYKKNERSFNVTFEKKTLNRKVRHLI